MKKRDVGTDYLVSACLAGENCRYDGSNVLDERIAGLVTAGRAAAVCPEVLGGLPVPREPCEIQSVKGGPVKVISQSGRDCTKYFRKGAERVLRIARKSGIKTAILKSRSPSCGCGSIYDGTFSGRLVEGRGVTADLLIRNGISVFTEDEWSVIS